VEAIHRARSFRGDATVFAECRLRVNDDELLLKSYDDNDDDDDDHDHEMYVALQQVGLNH